MGRLKVVWVVAALAGVVSVVAAGSAAAAKGGNNENAHACQQGGHENRFEAETGIRSRTRALALVTEPRAARRPRCRS